MKYLPEDLRREYDFISRNNPDIEGLIHPLINLSDTFRAYFILIHYFTDESGSEETERMLVGIRSIDLLASALSRQVVSLGGRRKYSDPIDICATLFYGMVKNHSFNDGNKRTALLILLYQLNLFGYVPTAHKRDFEDLVLSVAASDLDVKYKSYYKKFRKDDDPEVRTISYMLKRMVTKKDSSYHVSPSMKDFCAALEGLGVVWQMDNGKIKFTYSLKGKWKLFYPEEKNYALIFGGWTRTVGAKNAREVLSALGLYEQIPSYEAFLGGVEPMYSLVDDFNEPLRRLKDK